MTVLVATWQSMRAEQSDGGGQGRSSKHLLRATLALFAVSRVDAMGLSQCARGLGVADLYLGWEWRHVRLINVGGFGEVHAVEAVEPSSSRPRTAAMKLLKGDLYGDLDQARRVWRAFRREVEALRHAQGHHRHPHLGDVVRRVPGHAARRDGR